MRDVHRIANEVVPRVPGRHALVFRSSCVAATAFRGARIDAGQDYELAEGNRSHDQEQPCPDDDGSNGSRCALTRRGETFDGDGCRHDRHRAQIHDADDEEDRRQAGTAGGAVETEA